VSLITGAEESELPALHATEALGREASLAGTFTLEDIVEAEIDSLKEYVSFLEQYLQIEFARRLNAAIPLGTDQPWDDDIGNEIQYWKESFPSLARASVLPVAFAIIERVLAEHCKRIQSNRQSLPAGLESRPLMLEDLKFREGFQKNLRFIEILDPSRISLCQKESAILRVAYKLRNHTAHAGIQPPVDQSSQDKLNANLLKLTGVRLTQKGIIIDDTFAPWLLDIVRKFLLAFLARD